MAEPVDLDAVLEAMFASAGVDFQTVPGEIGAMVTFEDGKLKRTPITAEEFYLPPPRQ